jgi:hypothetical protein
MSTLVDPLVLAGPDDGPAISELYRVYALQRKAFGLTRIRTWTPAGPT